MRKDWKYTSPSLGWPSDRKRTKSRKIENEKPVKKVKVTIPALGVEKIFNSLKECCDTFGVEEKRINTYIKMGYAAKGIMLFKWEEEKYIKE